MQNSCVKLAHIQLLSVHLQRSSFDVDASAPKGMLSQRQFHMNTNDKDESNLVTKDELLS